MSEHGVRPGSLLGGRYRVDSLLGRGGMASVWSGVDQQLGRTIAIKVLHLDAADSASAWARFEREVRSTAAVNDPHIVTVHDTGIDDGVAYLVLEFLAGPTLSQHLTQHGPMPVSMILDVTAQVCQALAAAHALGIVHRDIKPSNVMFADHHRVKVLDFGITQLVGDTTSSEATLTATGEALGTPAFMAPEQIAGQRVDARTDLYALGCLVTAMLAGKPPFSDASPWSVIASHAHETPPDVRLARPDTPPALAELVADLLAKDPQQRPSSATDVLNTVTGIAVASETVTPAGSRRARRFAGAVVSLALLGAAVGSYAAAGAPGWPGTPGPANSSPVSSASTTAASATQSPTKVSLEAASLGGTQPADPPLTQWCQHPDGYGLSYPEGWFVHVPPARGWDQSPCTYFGTVPLAEDAPGADAQVAPISVGIATDAGFDELSASRKGETITNREEERIGSLRLARIESTLDDNNGDDYLPDGTQIVRWVVELPPAGTAGVLVATAFPNGVVLNGAADDAQQKSMDVADNAAILDAMIRSVQVTVIDDSVVSLNESLVMTSEGLGEAKLGTTMTDLASALDADLLDLGGSEPCHRASLVAGGTGFTILSEGGRDGPVQVVETSAGMARPGRGRPVVATSKGIHLGSSYAQAIKAYPEAAVSPAPYSPGGERLTVADEGRGSALVFETDEDGTVILMRTGTVPQVEYDEGCS